MGKKSFETQRQYNEEESLKVQTSTHEELGMRINDDFLSGLNIGAIQEQIAENKEKSKERILEIRKTLTTFTNSIFSTEEQLGFANSMGLTRNLNEKLFTQAKCFYAYNSEEESRELFSTMLSEPDLGLTNSMGESRFTGRYMYPVLGFYGEVIGFSGYDMGSDIKYIRSDTAGFEKSYSFYGMQLMKYLYNKKYIIVQEGFVDSLWGWSIDQPFIGTMGDSLSEFLSRILNRFGMFKIFIPDNDNLDGQSPHRIPEKSQWFKRHPDASGILLEGVKDIDDWRTGMLEKGYTQEQVDLIFTSIINDILSSIVIGVPKKVTLRVWD